MTQLSTLFTERLSVCTLFFQHGCLVLINMLVSTWKARKGRRSEKTLIQKPVPDDVSKERIVWHLITTRRRSRKFSNWCTTCDFTVCIKRFSILCWSSCASSTPLPSSLKINPLIDNTNVCELNLEMRNKKGNLAFISKISSYINKEIYSRELSVHIFLAQCTYVLGSDLWTPFTYFIFTVAVSWEIANSPSQSVPSHQKMRITM